jgi:transcriptional regulator with XRE-family HTH domain
MAELEARWHDLGEFIREQRKVGHLSLRKLSDMAGISNPYLSQIERGLRKPSAEILQQIARALEISSETLYIRAGILEPREGDTDLITEIRRDIWLNEEQKKTLVQIYESFRAERRAAGFEPELVGQASLDVDDASSTDAEVVAPAALKVVAADDDSDDPESEALAGR